MDYADYFRRMYDREDPWSFGSSPFEKIRHSAMAEFILSLSPRRVLDLGCGEGHFLQHLLARSPEIRAVGIELEPRAAQRCRERLAGFRAEIIVSDLLDFLAGHPAGSGGPYDAIVCGDVLYFLNPETVAGRVAPAVKALLRPSGGLVLSYADVNSHEWTVDIFARLLTMRHAVYIRPMQEPPPWPWMVALLTREG